MQCALVLLDPSLFPLSLPKKSHLSNSKTFPTPCKSDPIFRRSTKSWVCAKNTLLFLNGALEGGKENKTQTIINCTFCYMFFVLHDTILIINLSKLNYVSNSLYNNMLNLQYIWYRCYFATHSNQSWSVGYSTDSKAASVHLNCRNPSCFRSMSPNSCSSYLLLWGR